MIAEEKQQYCGVLCSHCRQPIPLSPSAEHKEMEFKEQGPSGLDEFSLHSVTLRCRAGHGEGLYTRSDVIDCDGSPRKRGSQGRKSLLKFNSSGPSPAVSRWGRFKNHWKLRLTLAVESPQYAVATTA